MFLHICLITAGVHFGRRLWNDWQGQQAEPVEETEPRDEVETGREPLEEQPLSTTSAPPDAEGSTPAPLEPEVADEAEAQRQLMTAIAAMGLNAVAATYLPGLQLLGGVSVMYGSIPVFDKAWRLAVDEHRIGVEALDSVSLVASIAAGRYTLSAVMFLFYASVQKLRLDLESEFRESMRGVLGLPAGEARRWRDGVEESVRLESLRDGDIVVVSAGAPIPVDGVVTRGTALVDQRVLTGESALVEKSAGDEVFAVTIVSAGELHVQVRDTGQESRAAQISQALQGSTELASSVESEGKKLADASALPILALSALTYPVTGVRGALAMLNISIADNLLLIAPFSSLNYLRKAYEDGILLKGSGALRLLPSVDTVVFDETGTLELDPSLHPEALEIVRSLKARGLSLYLLSGESEASARELADRLGLDGYYSGISPPDRARILDDLQEQGKQVCFVGDGLHDSIAFESIRVSVSTRGASAVATDGAQVLLLGRGLGKLPELFDLALDFQSNLRGILLSAAIPAAIAAGGVLFVGYSTNMVAALYLASLASGMAVATWPHRDRLPQGTLA